MQFLSPNKHVRLTSNDSVDIQRLSESQSAGYERITQLLNTDTQLRSDLKPLVPSVHGYHCLKPSAASVHNDPDGFRCWKLNKWNVFRNKQTKKNKNYAEKRYRRGASNRKHVEDSNNLLADYLNSYSLQKMKGLLGIIRARDTDDIPVHSVELRINYQDVKVYSDRIIIRLGIL
ncbi:unnamed protein product [Anisakis simplex]|uniref:Transposase n=1 Tax=Anisakis simplex TaxID=6269 RepID=A0A0M3J6Q8_ANISI|nr:unnamed protein product [Anisakis simplex]